MTNGQEGSLIQELRSIKVRRPLRVPAIITARPGQINPRFWNPFHKGTDFAIPSGTPVFAVREGVVQSVGFQDQIGNYVFCLSKDVEYNEVRFGFFHLKSQTVKLGQKIMEHQIGFSGNTGTRRDGTQNPPHLHFQIQVNGPTMEVLKPEFIDA